VAREAENGTDHWRGMDTDLPLPALPVTQREERLKRGQTGRNLSVIDEGGELKISKTTAKRVERFQDVPCYVLTTS
jgi:hypothetical protein